MARYQILSLLLLSWPLPALGANPLHKGSGFHERLAVELEPDAPTLHKESVVASLDHKDNMTAAAHKDGQKHQELQAEHPSEGALNLAASWQSLTDPAIAKKYISYRLDNAVTTANEVSDQVTLWPLPAKVLIVVLLFFLMEHVLDFLPTCAIYKPVGSDLKTGVEPLLVPSEATLEGGKILAQNMKEDPSLVGRISVLSLNVWVNNARENAVLQIKRIRALQPDVICLQEVFHLDVLEAYRLGFPEYTLVAFGRAHNVSALLALLGIMISLATLFANVILFIERWAPARWRMIWLFGLPVIMLAYSRLIRHHWTIAFLTGNRTGLALLVRTATIDVDENNARCNLFSREGHAADLLNILRPRGYISVPGTFKVGEGSESLAVRFSTTHLNQPLEQALGDGRHRQVREILHHCLRDNELFIIGCDLNATPPGTLNGSDCNTYMDMAAKTDDCWILCNPSDPTRDGLTWDQRSNPMCNSPINRLFYGSKPLRWRCDYIFFRGPTVPQVGPGSAQASQASQAAQAAQAEQAGPSVQAVQPVEKAGKADKANKPLLDVSVKSCDMVFTGSEAVSDHFGIHTVFDIRRRA